MNAQIVNEDDLKAWALVQPPKRSPLHSLTGGNVYRCCGDWGLDTPGYPISGELLPAGTVTEVAVAAMCGHCRADLDRATFYDGLQINCHRCGKPLWFEVVDGQVIQHPGKPKPIADR